MKWKLRCLVLTAFACACGSTESGNPDVVGPSAPTHSPPGATGVAPSSVPNGNVPALSMPTNEQEQLPCEVVLVAGADAAPSDAAPSDDGGGPALLFRCSVVGGEIACECGVDPGTVAVQGAQFPSADECRLALFSQCGQALFGDGDAGRDEADASVSSR